MVTSSSRTSSGSGSASSTPRPEFSSSTSPMAMTRRWSLGTRVPSPRPVLPSSPVRVAICVRRCPMAAGLCPLRRWLDARQVAARRRLVRLARTNRPTDEPCDNEVIVKFDGRRRHRAAHRRAPWRWTTAAAMAGPRVPAAGMPRPAGPTGKVLLVDKVLAIAEAAGSQGFADAAWADSLCARRCGGLAPAVDPRGRAQHQRRLLSVSRPAAPPGAAAAGAGASSRRRGRQSRGRVR